MLKVANIAVAFLVFQSRLYNLHFSGVCNNVGNAVQDFEVITLLAKVPAAECKSLRRGIALSCTCGAAFEASLAALSRKYMSAVLC